MYGVILTAHSEYPTGVYSALKLVCGDMENVKVVNYLEGQNYEQLEENIEKAYNELSGYEKIIFLTDLLGGTPFSRSVLKYGNNNNVRVLSGLNFSLLYSASTIECSDDMDKDIEEIIEAGRTGITVYEKSVSEQQESEEDGI